MCQLIYFRTFQEYFDVTNEVKDYNPFLYYYLEESIKNIAKNKEHFEKFFYIKEKEDYTFCLWKKDECLIYANNENEGIINLLIKELKFENFKRFTFSGTKNIIQNIFEKYDVSYDVIKFRKYYKCDAITNNFNKSDGNLEMANENYLMRLAGFTNKFNEEFYGEFQSKSYGINVVLNGIMKKNLFQWCIEKNPVAILQVNYDDFDFPLIGFVYVDQNLRNKNIGASIVYEVTKGLLENGFKECMLYTNGNNIYSNKSFINSGYKLVGEYVSYYKKK